MLSVGVILKLWTGTEQLTQEKPVDIKNSITGFFDEVVKYRVSNIIFC